MTTPTLPAAGASRRLGRGILVGIMVAGLVVLAIGIRHSLLDATVKLAGMHLVALAALPLFALWTVAASLGWRHTIVEAGVRRPPTLAGLCLMRLQAQSVNMLLPFAGLGGVAVRTAVLGRATRQAGASAVAVAFDVTAEIVACFLFAGLGVLVGWHAMRCTEAVRLAAVVGSLGLALLVWHAPRLIRRLVGWLPGRWHPNALRFLESAMGDGRRAGLIRSVAWHMVERALIAGETWVYLHALGLGCSLAQAVFATALMTLFGSLLFFIPGQVGAADGGLALGLLWAGFPWEVGLAVALARRLRQLVVATAGVIPLLAYGRHSVAEPSAGFELQSRGRGLEG